MHIHQLLRMYSNVARALVSSDKLLSSLRYIDQWQRQYCYQSHAGNIPVSSLNPIKVDDVASSSQPGPSGALVIFVKPCLISISMPQII
jgi:hypothetical protein